MCNRKCIFCPRSDPDYNHVNEFISISLHNKIVKELKDNSYGGTIIYSGFVEPLLDKDFMTILKILEKIYPM